MSVVIVPNPAFAGQQPRLLEALCHDRSPFLQVNCGCGGENHIHETQIVPRSSVTSMRCHRCREYIDVPTADLVAAFQQMREEGWIA